MRYAKSILAFSVASFLQPLSGWCDSNVGLLFKGAAEYRCTQLNGAFDLDRQARWRGELAFQHSDSQLDGLQSTTNSFSLGARRKIDDTAAWHGSLDFWRDTVNRLHSVGPAAGYERDFGEDWALGLDAELNFYGAEANTATSTVTTNPGGKSVVRASTATAETAQFHPSFILSKGLFEETLVPYFTAGHYFYSARPTALEIPISRVAGFLQNSYSLGTRVNFEDSSTTLTLELGRDQLESDADWATTFSAKATHTFDASVRVALGWSHSVLRDQPIDYGIGGVTIFF